MNARRWFITLTACVVLLLGLAGIKYAQIRAAIAFSESFPEPSESVLAEPVVLSTIQSFTRTIGEVVAPQQIMLSNELAGRITSVNMLSGQRVEKGQVLLQQDVSEDRARLEAAQANARLLNIKLARLQRLLQNRTTSQDAVDQAQAEFDIAKAAVSELRAVIAKKTLLAPFDAVVGLHKLEVGEYLDANSALVELVGVSDRLWVDFHLPLSQGDVAVGDAIQLSQPGSSGETLEAVVIARSAALSSQSRNRRYRAELAATARIPPNSIVDLRVPTALSEGVQLPSQAVLRDQLGAYVFRLQAEASGQGFRAQRQSVKLGRETEQRVTVLEGVSPGDVIATDGAFKLRHGMLTFIRARPHSSNQAESASTKTGAVVLKDGHDE